MRYLEKLDEARKKLRYTDEAERAIKADEKLQAATTEYKTLPPGQSAKKEKLLLRRQRALAVKQGRLKRVADKMDALNSHTSYQQIGDMLAEAMFGKIRTKVANKLDDISRKQYRRGEVADANDNTTEARIRGRAAHAAGKLAQKVRPRKKS